jgi:hypothetical protein
MSSGTALQFTPSAGDLASVYLRKKLCKPLAPAILDYISSRQMQQYWDKKKRIKSDDFHKVDWQAVGLAMKGLKAPRRRWVVKHANNTCGVNSKLVQWGKKTSPLCPRCDEVETSQHVYQCQDPAAANLWKSNIDNLRNWMVVHQTAPLL